MRLLLSSFALLLWGWGAALQPVAAAPTADAPMDVTQALYSSAIHHLGFTPETIKASRPWVTPGLYARLWKKVNQPVPKGDAPDIEGDVFLNSQEVPTLFKVGTPTVHGAQAKVEVTLLWDKEKRHYTVLLAQIDGAWKVDDIDYGKDGTLRDLLK